VVIAAAAVVRFGGCDSTGSGRVQGRGWFPARSTDPPSCGSTCWPGRRTTPEDGDLAPGRRARSRQLVHVLPALPGPRRGDASGVSRRGDVA